MTHSTIDSLTELSDWIALRLAMVESDLGDGETMQSLGVHGQARLNERRATLHDVQTRIAHAVAVEQADRELAKWTDAQEAAWREVGYAEMEPLVQRLMDGDR